MENLIDSIQDDIFQVDPLLGSDPFISTEPNQTRLPIQPSDQTEQKPLVLNTSPSSLPHLICGKDVQVNEQPFKFKPHFHSRTAFRIQCINRRRHRSPSWPSFSYSGWCKFRLEVGIRIRSGVMIRRFYCRQTTRVKGNDNYTEVIKSSEAKLTRGGAEHVEQRPCGCTDAAGTTVRYYVEPGTGQRFRSKIEVKRYLETGSKNKHSDPSAMPSEAKGTKTKKSGTKKKKEAAWSFDFENPPEEVTWSLVDKDQGLWNASIGEERVPETTAQEWATTFERACQMD